MMIFVGGAVAFLFFLSNSGILGTSCQELNHYPTSSSARGCEGKENNLPIYDSEPTLLREIKGKGKLMIVGDHDQNSTIEIIHLYGDDDERQGEVYGELLRAEIAFYYEVLVETFLYEEFVQGLPEDEQKWIEEQGGIDKVLDLVYDMTKQCTPSYFFDFMKGMARTSYVDYLLIRRFNLLTQYIKALPPDTACTILGSTLKSNPFEKLIQLRALDVGESASRILLFPLVIVHHYEESNTVVNIHSVGNVGSLTGFNKDLFLSTKVWVNHDHKSFKPDEGIVWNFHLFDILRKKNSYEDAIDDLRNHKRSIYTYLGIGDQTRNHFNVVNYGVYDFDVFDWKNQSEYEFHKKFEGVAYLDKAKQPSKMYCLPDLIEENYGNLTPETILRKISPVFQTGDAQSVIYDGAEGQVYVSYGMLDKKAYNSQYIKLDMEKLLEEPVP